MSEGGGAVATTPQTIPPVAVPPVPKIPLTLPVPATTPEPPVADGIGMLPPSDSPLHPAPAEITAVSASTPRNQAIDHMMTGTPARVHPESGARRRNWTPRVSGAGVRRASDRFPQPGIAPHEPGRRDVELGGVTERRSLVPVHGFAPALVALLEQL
jgi:hypothetical protein